MVIWKGIRETADEKLKDEDRMVKAIDFFDWSEVRSKSSIMYLHFITNSCSNE